MDSIKQEAYDTRLHGRSNVPTMEAAFCAPISQAVRQELNTLRRGGLRGLELLDVLGEIYHRHNMQDAVARRLGPDAVDDLPVVVCSQGLRRELARRDEPAMLQKSVTYACPRKRGKVTYG